MVNTAATRLEQATNLKWQKTDSSQRSPTVQLTSSQAFLTRRQKDASPPFRKLSCCCCCWLEPLAGNGLQLLLKLTKALNKQPLGLGLALPAPCIRCQNRTRGGALASPPKCCSLLGPKTPLLFEPSSPLCLAV